MDFQKTFPNNFEKSFYFFVDALFLLMPSPSWDVFVQIQQWKHQNNVEMCSRLAIKTPEMD